MSRAEVNVLFVCLGNICRSPTAAAVMEGMLNERGLSDRVFVDSAGTAAYHSGNAPDPRSQDAGRRRGYDLSRQRARQATRADFETFDYVIAMDRDNYAELASMCPPGREDRLSMLMQFAPELGEDDVPDPYYGGRAGFDHVIDLVEAAVKGLLEDVEARFLQPG